MSFINIINESFDKQNKSILAGSKSKKLKEAVEKVYKYIVVNHFSPEDFYLVKSNHPVDENIFDSWNFLDVTDKHGKGTVIWNDEDIIFNEVGNKSIADLDNEYREGVVRYLSDLEKNGNLDTIKDEYISFDELEYEGYLTDFPAWLDPGDGDGVIEEYMNDKTLKNSYLATAYSDYLENSYVDKDSSSAAAYVDIDDLNQYTDYEEFFDEDDEDDDLDENIFIKKQKRKPQKLKEAAKKVYKYIIVDPDDPENFMLVKSGTKLGSNDFDWNFLDITDKHGKGIVTWDDEYINFRNSKSPEELDEIYRQALVKYLSGLDRKHQLDNIKDEYIVIEDLMDLDLIDEDDFLGLPDPGRGEDVVEAYREDKTLKDTYLSSLVSDFLNYSYVDNDSSSASQYVDIDDLSQYVDYKDFSDDEDENNSDSLDDEAKIEKLKHLDHIPDKFFADSQIKSIVIPDNIKSIGDHAFEWCEFLSQITIPTSVVKIGSGAFYGNEGLKTVTYKGTRAEWWNKIDFADDWDDECYIRKIKCTDGILSL